jgi:ubiquinone/menaquinone biosynthesis C-methylase UbiE
MQNADNVGDYLISSRSLREYEAMFALTEKDFRGSVLDCPGGASSFTVQASDLGAAAVAVDRYLWDFYGDLLGHREIRKNAAALFSEDLEVHPERYVPASLPVLPFEDGQFDLVLSSHFLFTYADRLDLGFHCRALIEMHRVCAGEVRVFPLLDQAGNPLDTLTRALLTALDRDGVAADIREVPYEFQRGGNRMLVLATG